MKKWQDEQEKQRKKLQEEKTQKEKSAYSIFDRIYKYLNRESTEE